MMDASRGHLNHHGLRYSIKTGGYQFYTTTGTPQWFYSSSFGYLPTGSSIVIPTPKEPTEDQVDPIRIVPEPYLSTVQTPPLNDQGNPVWNYIETPSTLEEFNTLMNQSMFPQKDIWQINGIPEPIYYVTSLYDGSKIKVHKKLLNAWTEVGGMMYGAGTASPVRYTETFFDIGYDVAPGVMTRSTGVKQQMPDGDWPQRACLRQVTTGDWTRTFIILSTSDDAFICWPILLSDQFDSSLIDNASPELLAQSYKANIPDQYAVTITPDYPSWVYLKNLMERIDMTDTRPDPRYRWSFNSTGTSAISVMIERTPFTETWQKIKYSYPGQVDWFTVLQNNAGFALWPNNSTPFNEDTEVNVQVNSFGLFDGTHQVSPVTPIYEDRFGVVELEFQLELTGPALDEFTFAIAIKSSASPTDLEALNLGMLFEVAYAMPLNWAKISSVSNDGLLPKNSNMTVSPLTGNPPLYTDDIVSAWTTLYWCSMQKAIDKGYNGAISPNVPSKSKISFYKGAIGSQSLLFELPLSQAHGAGYTESDPESLPPAPHEFITCRANLLGERWPFIINSEDESRYEYSATLTHLDLKSLSFYYTARIIQFKRDADSLLDYYGEPSNTNFPWRAQTGELCIPFVFGRNVEKKYCGNTTRPFRLWLEGWIGQSCETWPDDDEEVFPLDYRIPFRGLCPTRVPDVYDIATAYYGALWYPPTRSLNNSVYSNTSRTNAEGLYHFFLSEQATKISFPWWLSGQCGTITRQVLNFSYANAIGAETHPEVEAITFYSRETIIDLIDVVESWFDTYMATANPFVQGTNPFYSLNFKLPDSTSWKEDIADLFWMYVEKIQDAANNDVYTGVIGISGFFGTNCKGQQNLLREDYVDFNFLVYYAFSGDYARFQIPEEFDIEADDYYFNNFFWGLHSYHTHRIRHCSSPRMEMRSAIQVTPEGHFSYCLQSHFSLIGEYPCFVTGYGTDAVSSPDVEFKSPVSIRPYFSNAGSGVDPDGFFAFFDSDVDWQLVDKIGWHYGKVYSSHLSCYNFAYNPNRGQVGAPEFLESGETLEDFYDAESFKPDIVFVHGGQEMTLKGGSKADSFLTPFSYLFTPLHDNVARPASIFGIVFGEEDEKTLLRISPSFF